MSAVGGIAAALVVPVDLLCDFHHRRTIRSGGHAFIRPFLPANGWSETRLTQCYRDAGRQHYRGGLVERPGKLGHGLIFGGNEQAVWWYPCHCYAYNDPILAGVIASMAHHAVDEEVARRWHERKSILMEASLGKEHDIVMHAIIPYCVGGALDLYYYPKGLPGTAIATKELSELPNAGSSNNVFSCYELVMFTKQKLDLGAANDESTAFGREHSKINAILNPIARYSAEAKLNPHETCEFPANMARVGGKCLIFDGYACHSDDMVENFGLLAVIEIFRSEMDYARARGSRRLIDQLKSNGYYPYSDLDREAVF
jgi:hypothetical protein